MPAKSHVPNRMISDRRTPNLALAIGLSKSIDSSNNHNLIRYVSVAFGKILCLIFTL